VLVWPSLCIGQPSVPAMLHVDSHKVNLHLLCSSTPDAVGLVVLKVIVGGGISFGGKKRSKWKVFILWREANVLAGK